MRRVSLADSEGTTALHIAAATNMVPIVNRLLSQRADVNVCDAQGRTPLHLAVEADNREVISAMLNVPGARVDSRDKNDRTILWLAL